LPKDLQDIITQYSGQWAYEGICTNFDKDSIWRREMIKAMM